MDMPKFKDGRVHFEKSGLKRFKMFKPKPLLQFAICPNGQAGKHIITKTYLYNFDPLSYSKTEVL